jgi:dihydrolipoamide dehydrogenase
MSIGNRFYLRFDNRFANLSNSRVDKGIEELAECVHPHPSITEGIQECVRMLLGKSLFKPSALRGRISCRSYKNGVYEDIKF